MIREILEDLDINERRMDDDSFIQAMMDLADKKGTKYYSKMNTKDMIGDLLTDMRKNDEKTHQYWNSKPGAKRKALYDKAFKAFD